MTDIPDRERGYSVEADTAVVHERYQDHAPRAMRTSALGVTNVLDGREAALCPTCFPVPKVAKGKRGFTGPIQAADLYFVSEDIADIADAPLEPSAGHEGTWPTQPTESVTVTSESEPA